VEARRGGEVIRLVRIGVTIRAPDGRKVREVFTEEIEIEKGMAKSDVELEVRDLIPDLVGYEWEYVEA
jgi:hypothetical protein